MCKSFTDTPRIPNKPFSKKIGNDLLERDKNGCVSRSFNYFSPLQMMLREEQSNKLFNEVKDMFKEFFP